MIVAIEDTIGNKIRTQTCYMKRKLLFFIIFKSIDTMREVCLNDNNGLES